MSVRIRLQRHGRKQTPIYHIVIADARSPRDGSFIERIGMYNPMTKPATIEIDRMKAYTWLQNGAQPTDTVHAILRFKGVMYYKHLQRGVGKGAMTPEEAELKFSAWVEEKEARIEARVKATAAERKERAAQVSGTKKTAKKKQAVKDDDELLNVDLAESAAAETAVDTSPEAVETTADTSADTPTESTVETNEINAGETDATAETSEENTAEATAENEAADNPSESESETKS